VIIYSCGDKKCPSLARFFVKGIEHKFTVPYYHKGNGRVERVNRTLRNALKKAERSPKFCLSEVVKNYNNLNHRGIGMNPTMALAKENWEKY
ncbi:hypothetical protein H312_02718, partial [Anncaliia algerae PRA339]